MTTYLKDLSRPFVDWFKKRKWCNKDGVDIIRISVRFCDQTGGDVM